MNIKEIIQQEVQKKMDIISELCIEFADYTKKYPETPTLELWNKFIQEYDSK